MSFIECAAFTTGPASFDGGGPGAGMEIAGFDCPKPAPKF
jgi:hypothetical protein